MRKTFQKDLIYNIIDSSHSHLDAKETYEIAKQTKKDISLGTVYRILNDLADHNKILRITTKNNVIHFDRIPKERHSHFICNKCGKIVDIFSARYAYDELELNGYQIENVEFTLTGLCDDCTKERNNKNGTKR